MCSLVINPFSHDFIMEIRRLIKVSEMFQLTLPYIQYSHNAWFLDGRTSILVSVPVISRIQYLLDGWVGGDGWVGEEPKAVG